MEALLVNRIGAAREYFLVPIDECYKLVGIFRLYWRGLSGGAAVWGEIVDFFETLRRIGNMNGTRLVEVLRKVLNKNDLAAHALRDCFEAAKVCVISLVSSPGSGKTAFLELILFALRPEYNIAALVGDLATDNDARRLARSQAPVKQISTGTVCHLDAHMVSATLDEWRLADLDFLFIENVGNLVCPSSYDLGEKARMVLLS